MKKLIIIIIFIVFGVLLTNHILKNNNISKIVINNEIISNNNSNDTNLINSSKDLSKFKINEVYKSKNNGDIHYSVYIPNNYDQNKKYPLYITLPGYEGLYFQGVGINLEYESFATEALKINEDMIILAPQLNDWEELSANQTIDLIEYYKKNYNISKVYANGYSGGGETMSLVMGKRADLIDAYLQVSSKWDGDFELTVKNEVPVYFVIGKDDEYYTSKPTTEAYNKLYSLYKEKGLSDKEINKLLILDIKDRKYFIKRGMDNEHGGGGLIAFDKDIMTWLLTR